MLLLPQKKKIATIVMSKLMPKETRESGDFIQRDVKSEPAEGSLANPEEENSPALESCMVAFLHGIERKSPSDMVSALKDFFYMCDEEEEQGPSPLEDVE